MPQVDLETLLQQGGRGRRQSGGGDGRSTVSDSPPDSFYLSREEELDWFNHNFFTLGKQDSPKKKKKKKNGSSRRYSYYSRLSSSAAAAAFIIGFRMRHRTVKSVDNVHFFPTQSNEIPEPSSPTISCTGQVMSRKRGWSGKTKTKTKTKSSIWSRLKRALLGNGNGNGNENRNGYGGNNHAMLVDPHEYDPFVDFAAAEHNHSRSPSLASLNRFVSGRKSDSWAPDLYTFQPQG